MILNYGKYYIDALEEQPPILAYLVIRRDDEESTNLHRG